MSHFTTKASGGHFGLGLTHSRDLIQDMGGRLFARRNSRTRGLELIIELPLVIMSDEKANTVSVSLTILCLCVFTAVAAYLGVPVKLGYLDLSAYQLPAFLLLRYVSAQRIAAPALALIAVMSYYTDFAIGVYAEVVSFLVLLFIIDGFASSGRAEHRLVVTLCAVLLVCFPLYTATLTFFREETLLGCRTRLYFCLFNCVCGGVCRATLGGINHYSQRFFRKFHVMTMAGAHPSAQALFSYQSWLSLYFLFFCKSGQHVGRLYCRRPPRI